MERFIFSYRSINNVSRASPVSRDEPGAGDSPVYVMESETCVKEQQR